MKTVKNKEKFASSEALLDAYTRLQAEFTRRCQKIKKLEEEIRRLNSAVDETDGAEIVSDTTFDEPLEVDMGSKKIASDLPFDEPLEKKRMNAGIVSDMTSDEPWDKLGSENGVRNTEITATEEEKVPTEEKIAVAQISVVTEEKTATEEKVPTEEKIAVAKISVISEEKIAAKEEVPKIAQIKAEGNVSEQREISVENAQEEREITDENAPQSEEITVIVKEEVLPFAESVDKAERERSVEPCAEEKDRLGTEDRRENGVKSNEIKQPQNEKPEKSGSAESGYNGVTPQPQDIEEQIRLRLKDSKFIDEVIMADPEITSRIIAAYLTQLTSTRGIPTLNGGRGSTFFSPKQRVKSLSEARALAEKLLE